LKKEVDWSLFNYGFAIPLDYQVVFKQVAGRYLQRGESKEIVLMIDGQSYKAKLNNNKIAEKFGKRADIIQVRYGESSEVAERLRGCFKRTYEYLKSIKQLQNAGEKTHIKLPEEYKEYIAVYTTEYDDTFIIEPIVSQDIETLKNIVAGKTERVIEAEFNFDAVDDTAGFKNVERITRIRKLNKKIGDNLKMLYEYRCQICGKLIGEEYDSHVVEAHHIDYFVNSLNNDASNQLIVCPNHHSIIHDVNPVFDRNQLAFLYDNGYKEKLVLNYHLNISK